MNNQEYLIQILLKLRSIGVKNDKILGAIEKIPPHFYYNLFNTHLINIFFLFLTFLNIAKLSHNHIYALLKLIL